MPHRILKLNILYRNFSRLNLYAAVHLPWQNSRNAIELVNEALKTKLQPGYFAYLIPEKCTTANTQKQYHNKGTTLQEHGSVRQISSTAKTTL